jgi:excisionase family DNA binding protein
MTRAEFAALLSDPDAVDALPAESLPGLIGQAEELKARVWTRLQAGARTPAPAPADTSGPDRLLTADEAAERLGVSKRWVYRRADSLPFTRRLTSGTLRFSERGMDRWQRSRKA